MRRRAVVWHVEMHRLLLTGLSVKEIAHEMDIALGTAKVYSHILCKKLGVSSRIELMAQEIERLKTGRTGRLGLQTFAA